MNRLLSVLMPIAALTLFAPADFAQARERVAASEAMARILPSGQYTGKNARGTCSVTVRAQGGILTVLVESPQTSLAYGLSDASPYYGVDERTGEIRASEALPRFGSMPTGTHSLSVVPNNRGEVLFRVAEIIFEDRSGDFGTLIECTVTR